MIIIRFLVMFLFMAFLYFLLLSPALWIWLILKAVFKKAIAKIRYKKTVLTAALIIMVGIELGGLFYMNAHPFVHYDKTAIPTETAEKVLTYVIDHPEKFRAENFGGFKIGKVTFKSRLQLFIVNDDASRICCDLSALPIGWNHWYFDVTENNEVTFGDTVLP